METLESRLTYQPRELKFGTSGRRGEVVHLTQLEIYINATAELRYLQTLDPADGGVAKGDDFYLASDLRPSSTSFVPDQGSRGEIAQAIEVAICDSGMNPVYLGQIPTPALMLYAISRGKGSMMVTGSHIPFDRNGYKTNTSRGELLKEHEAPIGKLVDQVRKAQYQEPFESSLFDEKGLFKTGHRALPEVVEAAKDEYLKRYTTFFRDASLKGKRLLVYQHSAVGRDQLVDLLRALGAEVVPVGRSDTFVPIDTENIDEAQLRLIQNLTDQAIARVGPVDAVLSVDGDSDRPLVLGVDQSGKVEFFSGDLLGMVTAEFLGADAVVVPISCNDGIDRGPLASVLEPKTKIGSPYVIAGMDNARRRGARVVCGWEANGGFLLGSDVQRDGAALKSLPTRDAFLPILCTLFSAQSKGVTLPGLFESLPRRYSRAALLKNFPRHISLRIMERFSPRDPRISDVRFASGHAAASDQHAASIALSDSESEQLNAIRSDLARFFTSHEGFVDIAGLNYIDGVRILFSNGDVAHFRPSGNADELRIYAVADSAIRAEAIAQSGVKTPGGILRALEGAVMVSD